MEQPVLRERPASPTLERLVSGSGPQVRHLAGRVDARSVQRVGLLLSGEAPDAAPGTVWFRTDDNTMGPPLDVLLLKMFRAGSAGLVLPQQGMPESARLLADKLEFPVLGVSRCDFSHVLEEWWQRVGLWNLHALDELYSCQSGLLHLAIEHNEVDAYLREAGRILDADLRMLEDGPAATCAEVVEIPWGLGRGSRLEVKWHGESPGDRKFAVDSLATLVSLLLDRDVASIESELRLRGELLLELLVDGGAPTGSVVRAAERFGIDLGMEHVVAIWDLEDFTALARRPDLSEARILRLKRDITCVIEAGVRASVGKVWVLPHLDSFVAALEPSAGFSPAEVLACLSGVQERLRPVLRQYGLKQISVGVGFAYSGAAGLRKSFEEAQESLLVGRSNFGEGSVTHFRDLGMHRFLFGWYNSPRSRALAGDFLAPILQEAPTEREKLIATLNAYLAARGRQSMAAKSLGIHRNSLRYRLDRITELLGLDLDDSSVQLVLQLALRLIPAGG